jgi:hypothetical protein
MAAAALNIGLTDLFWIFIVLTSLQPLLKQRLLEASRRKLIAQIERNRGSRVWSTCPVDALRSEGLS